jgi:hypothetical protein
MPAHTSSGRRLFGFDRVEWLMLLGSIFILGFVALAI